MISFTLNLNILLVPTGSVGIPSHQVNKWLQVYVSAHFLFYFQLHQYISGRFSSEYFISLWLNSVGLPAFYC